MLTKFLNGMTRQNFDFERTRLEFDFRKKFVGNCKENGIQYTKNIIPYFLSTELQVPCVQGAFFCNRPKPFLSHYQQPFSTKPEVVSDLLLLVLSSS